MSGAASRHKLMIIGLDSWVPGIVERLLAEGRLPHIKKLIERGAFTRTIPFWPCATGNNWCSIITGASPAVHGCDFKVWLPGHRLDEPQLGFDSRFCKAEQLWQTASRNGLTTVIVDYPQSYPVNAERVIHIGEDGAPDDSLREAFMPWGYTTDEVTGRGASVMSQVTAAAPNGWKNLGGRDGFLKVALPLQPSERSEYNVDDTLHCLIEKGTGVVSFHTEARDAGTPLGKTTVGKWTDWMIATVDTDRGAVEVAFKAKLLRLRDKPVQFKLYLTQGYPTGGFTVPADLSG